MKFLAPAVALTAIAARAAGAGAARCEPPGAHRGRTGGALRAPIPRTPQGDAKINFCHGFAQGAIDVELRHTEGKKPFCFPKPAADPHRHHERVRRLGARAAGTQDATGGRRALPVPGRALPLQMRRTARSLDWTASGRFLASRRSKGGSPGIGRAGARAARDIEELRRDPRVERRRPCAGARRGAGPDGRQRRRQIHAGADHGRQLPAPPPARCG